MITHFLGRNHGEHLANDPAPSLTNRDWPQAPILLAKGCQRPPAQPRSHNWCRLATGKKLHERSCLPQHLVRHARHQCILEVLRSKS